MKRFKEFSLILLGVIIALLIILYIFPWNQRINTTMKGIKCRISDDNYSENVSISIKGDYKHYLFKNDTFDGTITIDKYRFTSDGSYVSLEFNKGKSFLIYMNVVDGKAIQNPLGTIYCTPNFKKLLICIYEPVNDNSYNWDNNDGLFISAPTTSRNKALEIAENLSKTLNFR